MTQAPAVPVANPTRRFLGICLAGATAAQAVAAVIFFFAANWWDMAPGAKTGIIDAILLACAMAAILSAPHSFARAASVVAGMVVSGILFAVHGQIWQTGADSWELFAVWAASCLLWAVLSRVDAAWLTTAIIATMGAGLWIVSAVPEDAIPEHWTITLLALVPALVGVLRTGAALLPGTTPPGRWLTPVLVAMAAAFLGIGGVAFSDELPLPLGLALAAATMVAARPRWCGPWPFSIALILAVVLLETLLLRQLLNDAHSGMETALRLMLAAGAMLAGVASLSYVLKPLMQATMRLNSLMNAAIATGAWIAAITAAAGWAGFCSITFGDDHLGLLIALFSAAVALVTALRRRQPHIFGTQVRSAFATLAYAGLVAETTVWGEGLTAPAMAAALLLPVLLWLVHTSAAGALATLIAVTVAAWRLFDAGSVPLAGFAVILGFAGWAGIGHGRASVRAAAVCLLGAAFVIPGLQEVIPPYDAAIPRAAAAFTAAGLMAATVWRRRDLAEPRIIGAGLVTLAGSLAVPAGGAGLIGLTATAALGIGRPLVTLGFAMAAWSVVRFYYLLATPLSDKAGMLAMGAAFTAVAGIMMTGLPRGRPSWKPASVLLLAGALLPMAMEAVDARAKAAIVAQGREVLLPLRPADPRSLIQGDFMALRYADSLTAALPRWGGMALLSVDGDQVASGSRLADGTPQANEIPVKVRPGRDAPRLAPESFLFQEGTGTEWAKARFAIVRIADGELVLTGLADQQRRPISP